MSEASAVIWSCLHFNDLSCAQLRQVYTARQQVFVIEQAIRYVDADAVDDVAHHLTCWRDGALIAYLRLVPPGVKFAEPALGRILTTRAGRGQGIGKKLVRRGIEESERFYPGLGNRISAQHYLERFYHDLGYVTVSDVYDEEGIPHLEMLYPPPQQSVKAITI
ncbi:MAG: GNAT family N-acetyltransferase [Alphaproteobacteria bacterium]